MMVILKIVIKVVNNHDNNHDLVLSTTIFFENIVIDIFCTIYC